MREIIRRALRACGYEVTRWRPPELSSMLDIQSLFGRQSLEVIFDVGANEGQTACQFAKAFPNAIIHSFEPFNLAFRKLSEVSARCSRIKPIQSALGDAVGDHILYMNSKSVTNSLLPNSVEADRYQPRGSSTERGRVPVQVSTVDAYCERESIVFIDLLKTDTQGYDLRVLQGAEKMLGSGNIATIFCEVLFASLYEGQAYFQDIYGHLWARGFRMVGLYDDGGMNEDKFMSWCDALFVHPEVLAQRLRQPDER